MLQENIERIASVPRGHFNSLSPGICREAQKLLANRGRPLFMQVERAQFLTRPDDQRRQDRLIMAAVSLVWSKSKLVLVLEDAPYDVPLPTSLRIPSELRAVFVRSTDEEVEGTYVMAKTGSPTKLLVMHLMRVGPGFVFIWSLENLLTPLDRFDPANRDLVKQMRLACWAFLSDANPPLPRGIPRSQRTRVTHDGVTVSFVDEDIAVLGAPLRAGGETHDGTSGSETPKPAGEENHDGTSGREATKPGKRKRPHERREHKTHVRIGTRDKWKYEEREIPRIYVNAKGPEDLPVTVRQVRARPLRREPGHPPI